MWKETTMAAAALARVATVVAVVATAAVLTVLAEEAKEVPMASVKDMQGREQVARARTGKEAASMVTAAVVMEHAAAAGEGVNVRPAEAMELERWETGVRVKPMAAAGAAVARVAVVATARAMQPVPPSHSYAP